jgi:hypothetical protein
LLWIILLSACYRAFGVGEMALLLLNLGCAVLLLAIVYTILQRRGVPPLSTFAALLLLIFVTPLTALIFSGMEHTLQTAIVISVSYVAAEELAKRHIGPNRGNSLLFWLLAPLVTFIRFEGLFLVVVVGGLLLFRKRIMTACAWGALAVFPVVVYAYISRSHGWYWLPNTVILKGHWQALGSPGAAISTLARVTIMNYMFAPHLVALMLLVLGLEVYGNEEKESVWESTHVLAYIFVGTSLLHLSFAATGWFFRYEAYLVGLGIVVVLLEISDLVTKRKLIVRIRREMIWRNAAAILLAIILLSPLFYRAAAAFINTPKASTNTFQQQYQMGLFLKRYYQGSTVAVNDLGAVNFFADLHCLDLCGLASMEVAELIRQGRYQTEYMRRITKQENVKIAMVYDTWFSGGRYCKLPAEWTRVGQWTIPNNVIASSETVSIYAIDASERDRLVENLRDFSSQLPREVVQTDLYTAHN